MTTRSFSTLFAAAWAAKHGVPPAVFTEVAPPANYFRFRVNPTHTIAISSFNKVHGEVFRGESRELTVSEHMDPLDTGAYEELLTDAVHGVSARFARQDYVEEAWRMVAPKRLAAAHLGEPAVRRFR